VHLVYSISSPNTVFEYCWFHIITTIATIAAIAGKNVQQSLRLCGNHFLAIVAITTVIWKPAYMETAQRPKSQRPLNFFGSDRRDRSDHMETSLQFYIGEGTATSLKRVASHRDPKFKVRISFTGYGTFFYQMDLSRSPKCLSYSPNCQKYSYTELLCGFMIFIVR